MHEKSCNSGDMIMWTMFLMVGTALTVVVSIGIVHFFDEIGIGERWWSEQDGIGHTINWSPLNAASDAIRHCTVEHTDLIDADGARVINLNNITDYEKAVESLNNPMHPNYKASNRTYFDANDALRCAKERIQANTRITLGVGALVMAASNAYSLWTEDDSDISSLRFTGLVLGYLFLALLLAMSFDTNSNMMKFVFFAGCTVIGFSLATALFIPCTAGYNYSLKHPITERYTKPGKLTKSMLARKKKESDNQSSVLVPVPVTGTGDAGTSIGTPDAKSGLESGPDAIISKGEPVTGTCTTKTLEQGTTRSVKFPDLGNKATDTVTEGPVTTRDSFMTVEHPPQETHRTDGTDGTVRSEYRRRLCQFTKATTPIKALTSKISYHLAGTRN